MPVDRWRDADSSRPRLIRHYQTGDPEPLADTVVLCPDGQERQRYGDLAWFPGSYTWSQLLMTWPGAITEEIRYSRPATGLGRVLGAQPGYLYDSDPGLWRWDGSDWRPLRPGDRIRTEDHRTGIWDGRTVQLDDPDQPPAVEITDEAWAAASSVKMPPVEPADLVTIDGHDLMTVHARRCVEAVAPVLHETWCGGNPRIALPADWKDQLDNANAGGHSGVSLVVSWLLADTRGSAAGNARGGS